MRRGLLDNGYQELPILSAHVVEVQSLPPIHKDPFDRLLVAQATVEGITLVIMDSVVARYPGPIRNYEFKKGVDCSAPYPATCPEPNRPNRLSFTDN